MKNNVMEVIENHECEILEKFNSRFKRPDIGIQRLSNLQWYWIRWNDKKGNTADSIIYCPYCGEKL